jgi:2-polyprenyl-3-methyl-5-hydroxy-6-metoxy-1,4-benzoquinol methylase
LERRYTDRTIECGSNPQTGMGPHLKLQIGIARFDDGDADGNASRPIVSVQESQRDNWNRHWQEYSETAEQNPAQAYRRQLIFSLLDLEGSGQGTRVIDIGSGQGDMAAAIHARFPSAEILGLELAESGVNVSRRKIPSARFVQRDLLDESQPGIDQRGWATHAVCSEVIEHLDDPVRLLRNARAYMSKGCCLVLTAPGGPMSAFDKHIGHRKHWRPREIEIVLRDAGYTPEHVTGMGFPFFNLYRCTVILRGEKLIRDVAAGPAGGTSASARAAMSVFRRLMRPSLNSSRWGWQMIAKARV